jgi:hypothetical protein
MATGSGTAWPGGCAGSTQVQRTEVGEYMAAARINSSIYMLGLVIKCQGITVDMRMTPYTGCRCFTGMVLGQRWIPVALGAVAGT